MSSSVLTNSKRIFLVVLALLLQTIVAIAPAPASNTQTSLQLALNSSPQALLLSDASSVSQNFTVKDVEVPTTATSTWSPNWFGFAFCWSGISGGFSAASPSCGQLGYFVRSKQGNRLEVNFSFTLHKGLGFEYTSPMNNDHYCYQRESDQDVVVSGTRTKYTVCYQNVLLDINQEYKMTIERARNTDNTYFASLTNVRTSESTRTSQIKVFGNDTKSGLFNVVNQLSYFGDARCDRIPVLQVEVGPVYSSSGIRATQYFERGLANPWLEGCQFAKFERLANESYLLGLGGDSPRWIANPNPVNPTPSPTPRPTNPVATPTPTQNPGNNVPATPTFSLVNFSGNTVKIDVNLGNTSPDKVYLVAPALGISSGFPILGTIIGNVASWVIDFGRLAGVNMIPLEVVSEKDGVLSKPLRGTYQAPQVASLATSTRVPEAPKNFTSRVIGTSAVITVETDQRPGALATEVYLFSNSLGISKKKALKGDVVGSKALIEVPIKASMAGKKYPVTVYYKNSVGESVPISETLSIPAAPSIPSIPTVIPAPKVAKTVICTRAKQTRAFEGDFCPKGWTKR